VNYGPATVTGVTIGGVAASVALSALAASNNKIDIWLAALAAGAAADVVISYNVFNYTEIAFSFSLTGAGSPVPSSAAEVAYLGAANPQIIIPTNGAGLWLAWGNFGGDSMLWNAGAVAVDLYGTGPSHGAAMAHLQTAGSQTLTASGPGGLAVAAASWGP
jgi:hypothetical protein